MHIHIWYLLGAAALTAARTCARFTHREPFHWSRFSFRFPLCRSFDESYSGIGFAPCRASIIPT